MVTLLLLFIHNRIKDDIEVHMYVNDIRNKRVSVVMKVKFKQNDM